MDERQPLCSAGSRVNRQPASRGIRDLTEDATRNGETHVGLVLKGLSLRRDRDPGQDVQATGAASHHTDA